MRPGFGHGKSAIERAEAAALRRRVNWVLPGSFGLLVLICDYLYTTSNSVSLGLGYLAGRIILFDYLIFLFGWVCAWSAAWKWRRNQGFVEELATTNLRPAVIGNLLFAGGLAVWMRVLFVIGLADMVLLLFKLWAQSISLARGVSVGEQVYALALHVPFLVVTQLVLAWFHLESLRIAYWMFATAALPRISLIVKAITNFVVILLYVMLLTAVGSAISGTCGIVLSAIFGSVPGGFSTFESQILWSVCSLLGLVTVGMMKRGVSRLYEHEFVHSFLLFTWWGAGETSQPHTYPHGMQLQLVPWTAYLRLEEEQISGKTRVKSVTEPYRPPEATEYDPMKDARKPIPPSEDS